MTLRAMRLGVPAEYDMACQLVETARNTSQRLLQVFLEAACSDANVGRAISQLQCHHQSATDLAYDRLLQHMPTGQRHACDDHVQ